MDQGHRVNELRSIELHRRVAELLTDDVVSAAHRRASTWVSDGGPVPRDAAEAWLELLAGPRQRLVDALIEDSERMRDLRQNTPFAGVVPNAERWEIVRAIG